MEFSIEYPSGIKFKREGDFSLVYLEAGVAVPCILEKGNTTAYFLDPRAIVKRPDGSVRYSPRKNKRLGADWRDWLKSHPEWDVVEAG